MQILLVEDDKVLGIELRDVLRAAGFVVDLCRDGISARDHEEIDRFDAAVVDLGLPRIDGLDVIADWRGRGLKLPVLILTARDRFADMVAGFRGGADDFLRKPVNNDELVVRLFALIRRSAGHAEPQIRCGDIALDTITGSISKSGMPMRMTAFEGRILRYLLHRKGAVVSRTELADHVYEHDADADFNSIEVLVSRLRRKISPARIESVRGEGYALRPPDHA